MNVVNIELDSVLNKTQAKSYWVARLSLGDRSKELEGVEKGVSDNQALLYACLKALKALKRPCTIEVTTHNVYLVDGMAGQIEQWKDQRWLTSSRLPVENADLWKQLYEASQPHNIRWNLKPAHQSGLQDQLSNLIQSSRVEEGQGTSQIANSDIAHDVTTDIESPEITSDDQFKNVKVVIYSDGSCLGNPGSGGWAAIIRGGGVQSEICGGEFNTTNNRMELMAAIEAMESTQARYIHLITDSEYVINGATKWIPGWLKSGWRTKGKKPVKNADLWKRLNLTMAGRVITTEWVKGHSGHEMNETVDVLAREQANLIKAAEALKKHHG